MIVKQIGTYCGFTLESDIDIQASCRCNTVNSNVHEYVFSFEWDSVLVQKDSHFALHYYEPLKNAYCMWHPGTHQKRVLDGCWLLHHSSRLTFSAPVAVIFDALDMNTITVAISEVKKQIAFHLGTDDDIDLLRCDIDVPLFQFSTISSTSFTVRFDRSKMRYEKTLKAVGDWWEKVNEIKPLTVPKLARMPIYSSWYAFHQKVDQAMIEKECRTAADMGLSAIILDDGWQQDEVRCGYRYTGDWEFSQSKFPDFKQHVQNVHDMGLKYILWFSVPFIGQESKRINVFRDMLLESNDMYGTLDPRYPQVRDFLVELFVRFIREYDLDGFKLDFIDRFQVYGDNSTKDGMDYTCVQEATDRLMQDITNALTALKPEILIEFRQSYIGPMMRKYGNMLRVGDCSLDAITNRIGVVDIRLLTPDRAVHGDMLTWNNAETTENAALQILAVLFGVMQVSKIVSQMTPEHRKMTEFWINFAIEHEKVLQESEFIAEEPHQMYPIIRAFDEKEEIIGVYARNKVVKLCPCRQHIIIVNATQEEKVIVSNDKELCMKIIARNTYGEEIYCKEMILNAGITAISCPRSGLIDITI